MKKNSDLITIAIESSCDETACAVMREDARSSPASSRHR